MWFHLYAIQKIKTILSKFSFRIKIEKFVKFNLSYDISLKKSPKSSKESKTVIRKTEMFKSAILDKLDFRNGFVEN